MALNIQKKTAEEKAKLKIRECEDDILLARDKLEIVKFLDKVIGSLKNQVDTYIQIAKNSDNTGWIMMLDGGQSGGQIAIMTWRNNEQVDASIVPLAEELGLTLDEREVFGKMLIYKAHLSKK